MRVVGMSVIDGTKRPMTAAIPDWSGLTVAILGTGPSLEQAQIDAVRAAGMKIVAVGRASERTCSRNAFRNAAGFSSADHCAAVNKPMRMPLLPDRYDTEVQAVRGGCQFLAAY